MGLIWRIIRRWRPGKDSGTIARVSPEQQRERQRSEALYYAFVLGVLGLGVVGIGVLGFQAAKALDRR